MRRAVRPTLLALVAFTALVVAPVAAAKIWFGSVGGQTLRPGDVVTTAVRGCPNPCPLRGTRVALGRGATPFQPVRRVTRILGTVDRRGRVSFRIPQLEPDRYYVIATFGRRWVAASDSFEIAAAG